MRITSCLRPGSSNQETSFAGSTRLLAINRDGVARRELICSWWNIVDVPDIDMLDDRISDSQPVRCDVRQMVFCRQRSRRRILRASGLQMFQVEIFRVFSISALLGFPRNDNCVHLARWYLARAAVSSPDVAGAALLLMG